MQTQQEQLVQWVDELRNVAREMCKTSRDPIPNMFGLQFHMFAYTLHRELREWSGLDQNIIESLKAGTTKHLLDLELTEELVRLLLDEFEPSLMPQDVEYARRILTLGRQIKALLNDIMERPHDTRLNTQLDSPAVRRKLSSEFDRILCNPACQMLEGIERLLADDNLNETQRSDLEAARRNARPLYRMLQTARPLIEAQNFRALALLSHEYRAPFCGITGFFRLLLKRENEGLQPHQLDQLNDLITYSHTTLGMVNDLIDTTKLLSGKYNDDTSDTINLHSTALSFKDTVERHRILYPQLAIQVQIPESLPSACINFLPQRCLYPILDNAFKYTQHGSICFEALNQGDAVEFRVHDTGIGIPEEEHERIFEPFTQVGEQTKGLGLGLFLARSYAKRGNASLTVESKVGAGSTFTLRIPTAS